MKKYLKLLILLFGLVYLGADGYGQSLQNHPPQPQMDHYEGHRGPPCKPAGWGNGNNGGGNGRIPPPVGLCLPINDYLLPLLLCGILLGSYAVFVAGQPSRKGFESSID